jgi:hypothetical protein
MTSIGLRQSCGRRHCRRYHWCVDPCRDERGRRVCLRRRRPSRRHASERAGSRCGPIAIRGDTGPLVRKYSRSRRGVAQKRMANFRSQSPTLHSRSGPQRARTIPHSRWCTLRVTTDRALPLNTTEDSALRLYCAALARIERSLYLPRRGQAETPASETRRNVPIQRPLTTLDYFLPYSST